MAAKKGRKASDDPYVDKAKAELVPFGEGRAASFYAGVRIEHERRDALESFP